MMQVTDIVCTNCGRGFPSHGSPYCCPVCGGLFDFSRLFHFDPSRIDPALPGIWRYRHAFGLPDRVAPASLGEGDTPLIRARAFGRELAVKCEYLNPTGSFKDRGSSIIAAWLKACGVELAVEDSSGNAGASFAAYAARAGMRARIFVPSAASGPKRRQIEAYGAELVPVAGSRSDVSAAIKLVADEGTAYASHAYLPFNLAGYATAAYEIHDQLGGMPGSVLVPAGQGGLLLGLARGFDAVRAAGNISEKPRMVGVQARACAPLWTLSTMGPQAMGFVAENPTLAEGVRVRYPLRGDAVLKAVEASGGTMAAVDEEAILPARDALARLGFYVEPTSAIVWAALAELIDKLPEPIVLVLTGAGFKYAENTII